MYDNYKIYVRTRILERSIPKETGCIEYQGNWGHKYGLISITVDGLRKSVPAHRALYMAVNDCFDLPRNTVVRHKCDNPRCVNIEHLVEGAHKDNAQDCIDRGRKAKTHKLHTRRRVFTDDQIIAIRNATGKAAWIAVEHGCSVGYVSKIKSGKAKTLV